MKVTGPAQPGQDPAQSTAAPVPTSGRKKLAVYFGAEALFSFAVAVLLFAVAGSGGGVAGGIAMCLLAGVLAVASWVARDPGRTVKMLIARREASIRRVEGT